MGLEVETFEIGKLTRCQKIDQSQGRGEYAYHSRLSKMKKGYVGLITWCRGRGGEQNTLRTYGLPPSHSEELIIQIPSESAQHASDKYEKAACKAYGFWQHSSFIGYSSYLYKKGVGSYGIRFCSSEKYGNAAVVPMHDENGKLWSCQILNDNGSKRMIAGSRAKGLFHRLKEPKNGDIIGIAESYVTAATCMELSGIPMVSCFSADNMPLVAASIRKLYPRSSIILFADNDRHLEERGLKNKGLLMAKKAIDVVGKSICMIEPEFVGVAPSKDASDWNDLLRIQGAKFTIEFIKEKIERADV